MGWNGSDKLGRPPKAKAKTVWPQTAVVLLILLFGAVAISLLASKRHPQDSDFVANSRRIPAVATRILDHTQITQANQATASVENVAQMASAPRKVLSDEDLVNPQNTNPTRRVVRLKPQPKRIFKHASEELIAGLVDWQPGDMVVGDIPFRKFEKDFAESLTSQIEYSDADSEFEKELKKAVQELKVEIRSLMSLENKSFADIMTEARQEQQMLAEYRLDLLDQLNALRKSGEYTADEYTMFVTAANRMLESKNIPAINIPAVHYRQIKLHQLKQ